MTTPATPRIPASTRFVRRLGRYYKDGVRSMMAR